MSRTRIVCLVACLALPSARTAWLAAEERPPNILFLLTDDQQPDTVHALGNPHIRTPHLDALARRGVHFTRAVCTNPICTPSRAEILTGCSGFRNGVVDFGRQIDPDLVTWPQAMRDAGYHTWYVGKWHNDGVPVTRGFEATRGLFRGGGGPFWKDQVDFKGSLVTGYRGWIFQDDEGRKFPERGVGLTPDISARFADAAIELLRRRPERPFFLQVAFTGPHDPLLAPPGISYDPYDIPLPPNYLPRHPFDHGNYLGRDERLMAFPREPHQVRRVIAMYYAVITHIDQQVGRILAALDETGQADNTIVIFSSDHGLGVGRHGIRGKQNMYEHTINVPLIVAGPGIPRGEARTAQCYLRDLYPTACDLAGMAIPETVQGKSLAGILRGKDQQVHPHVFCYFRDKQRMVRTDRYKLIHYPDIDHWQLFDLQRDPFELNNRADAPGFGEIRQELRSRLRASQRAFDDPLLPPGS